jgi:hypothetical protein
MVALITCTQVITQLITVKAQNVRTAAAVFSGSQKTKGRCRLRSQRLRNTQVLQDVTLFAGLVFPDVSKRPNYFIFMSLWIKKCRKRDAGPMGEG